MSSKENITIRVGTREDIDEIGTLYDHLNEHLEQNINYPGWKRGVYPARKDADMAVKEGSLYVLIRSNIIVGSMILRHTPEPAYLEVKWQRELNYEEILVIYTFVVHPAYWGQGIGKLMIDFSEEHAKKNGIKALRLDVYENNFPAIRLYEKCGFQYIETVSLGLEDCGLNWFKLYEKLL